MSVVSYWPAIAGAVFAAASFIAPAAAQVRTEPAAASLVTPGNARDARALFESGGMFMIAGGVLPAGHAVFLIEDGGTQRPVQAANVELTAMPDGGTALRTADATYRVDMPAGLACPLGEFTARDGMIAYTVPKYLDPGSRMALRRNGLVRHRIAQEFDNTPFETLLHAADFAQTEKLPGDMSQQIIAGINNANGINGMVLTVSDDLNTMVGSYINSGMQVTYHVYLEPRTGRVEIGGVPLRYYWKLDNTGAAGVFLVEIYAQNWGPDAHLTNLAVPNAQPTQYDVVNFYQVAALFHQLHETNPAAFDGFVQKTCGGKAI